MRKFSIAYGVISLIWLALCIFILPMSGEEGIGPALITSIITAPAGIIVGILLGKFKLGPAGELGTLVYTMTALLAGYLQWAFVIKVIKKIRSKQ